MISTDPIFKKHESSLSWLRDRTIMLTVHGSHAYGTSIPTSDTDYKGIAIPPREYFLGFTHHFEQAECKEPDAVIYDIRKFFDMAAGCNPNIIEVLFTEPEDHVIELPIFKKLQDNRQLFISKKAKHTFSGYAMAQMKRINVHYKWLKSPPKAAPSRAEFNLRPENEMSPMDRDNLATAMSMVEKEVAVWHDLEWTSLDEPQRIALRNHLTDYMARLTLTPMDLYERAGKRLGLDDNLIRLLCQEKGYKSARQEWDSYQTWLKTRNPARAELEAKWGYDTKHAGHLYRLLTMCREILTTGEVIVKRSPESREQILAIRNGAWKYEDLVGWSVKQDQELSALYETTNVIPNAPDRKRLEALCCEMVEEFNENHQG